MHVVLLHPLNLNMAHRGLAEPKEFKSTDESYHDKCIASHPAGQTALLRRDKSPIKEQSPCSHISLRAYIDNIQLSYLAKGLRVSRAFFLTHVPTVTSHAIPISE